MSDSTKELITIEDYKKQHEEDVTTLSKLFMKHLDLASMANSLANIILDSKDVSDNDRLYAEDSIKTVQFLLYGKAD